MKQRRSKVQQATSQDMVGYREAAQLLGLSLSTTYSKVSRKEIPHYRLGRRLVLFSRAELAAWLNERRVSPKTTAPKDTIPSEGAK